MYEAVVLAGGLGTRLRSVVKEVPKVMAMVAGKPFLHYIIKKLIQEKVTRIILSVGYKHEIIEAFISEAGYPAEFVFSIEQEPLGTGGAIKLAMEVVITQQVFILNGDSFFDCPLENLMKQHLLAKADISIALKSMVQFDRYGTVELEEGRIVKFNEKRPCDEGFINAGVYIIRRKVLDVLPLSKVFSIEKNVFEAYCSSLRIMGVPFQNYFIDIGIPEDFEKAQLDFS